MRITGGEVRGKTLRFPSGSTERPTSDFLREALFNLLGTPEDKIFLDLFAGSGSVGLEAASRGAREVYFIEKNIKLATVIQQNIDACCFTKNCFVMNKNIERGLNNLFKKKCIFDIVFADPPYNRNLVGITLEYLNRYPVFNENTLIIIQHSIKESLTRFSDDNVHWLDQRKYGDSALTFLKWRIKNAG